MSNDNIFVVGCLAIVAMVILISIFAPLCMIWAFNTLGITQNTPYTFWTWLAAWIICALLGGGAVKYIYK